MTKALLLAAVVCIVVAAVLAFQAPLEVAMAGGLTLILLGSALAIGYFIKTDREDEQGRVVSTKGRAA